MGSQLSGIALAPAQAQDLRPVHFSGMINDYSPSTVAGGPYEIRGEWSLDVVRGGTANFSADMTMETSDYGITGATAGGSGESGDARPTHSPYQHDERDGQL